MIKDTKYIIKRILIGVGIILVLSFIRGNKVKAVNIEEVKYVDPILNKEVNMVVDLDINPYYCYKINYLDNSTRFQFSLYSSSSPMKWYSATNFWNGFSGSLVNYQWYNSWNNATGSLNNQSYGPSNSNNYFAKFSLDYAIQTNQTNNNLLLYCNYTPLELNSNEPLNLQDYINGNGNNISSTIESLQPLKVNQESYIVAYVFKPKFSNFNIDSYIYQYRVGNNGTWLNISQNEEQITINNNNTIYFRILDRSNNEVVDSQTYTITDIGTLNNNLNYSIDFSTDYETLENTNIISKYFVDINYLPKSSVLKYQYQFVLEGSSLDNNNWNSLDTEVFSYNFETLQNGTLYARILDNEDNVLTTNTFTITVIGKFAINNNNKKNNGFFNKITSSINFGGPISGIINIPINLIKTLSTSIATNTCNNYNLGSLWGTTLVLPCVNIKQHLGDSLYFTIDLIIACVMIYHIIKMFGEFYTNLLFMQKNPIQDLGKRGD